MGLSGRLTFVQAARVVVKPGSWLAKVGGSINIQTDVKELDIFTIQGQALYSSPVNGGKLHLPESLSPGFYVLRDRHGRALGKLIIM